MPETLDSSTTPRYAIRCTYPNGEEAWYRRGYLFGEGTIVPYTDLDEARDVVESLQEGLDAGDTLTVVKYPEDD